MPNHFSRLHLTAWIAALAVAWGTLALTGYRSRDPDSNLHAAIEADQLARPARTWIAPEWAGHWNSEGLYREHPVGTFVPPVLLAKLGFPAGQAGYAVNAVYQVLALLVLARLAACFVPAAQAHSLLWLLQLLPVAFTYRVRANHEPALLFFFALAIYGTERSRRRPAWTLVTVVGVVGTMLVKGIFAVLVPPSCALWLLVSGAWIRRRLQADGRPATSSDRWAWAGIVISVVVALAVAAWYEAAYRAVTGQSFVVEYLRRQLGVAAAQSRAGLWIAAQKLRNFFFYAIRLLWFAVPWSLVLLWAGRPGARRLDEEGPGEIAAGRVGALLAVLAVAALWLGTFSLSDRLADRFIFPVYFLVGTAGAVFAMQRYPRFRTRLATVERRAPLFAPALWLVLFLLQIVSPHLGLPYVNR